MFEMKKVGYLLMPLFALLASCSAIAPLPTPTPFLLPPSPEPSPTATATLEPTATPEPTAVLGGEFRLQFTDLILDYDLAEWSPVLDERRGIGANSIVGCVMYEQGPTEFPDVTPVTVMLGNIEYAVFQNVLLVEGLRADWYAAQSGFDNPQPGNTPLLEVRSPVESWDACEAAAQLVLERLHAEVVAGPPLITPTPGLPATYTLNAGEHPFCIARRFNVDPGELLARNGLSPTSIVQPGDVLQIPQTGKPFPVQRALRSHPTAHTVLTGDTIYLVACRYGDVDPLAIAAVNNLAAPYTLTPGTTIQIP